MHKEDRGTDPSILLVSKWAETDVETLDVRNHRPQRHGYIVQRCNIPKHRRYMMQLHPLASTSGTSPRLPT